MRIGFDFESLWHILYSCTTIPRQSYVQCYYVRTSARNHAHRKCKEEHHCNNRKGSLIKKADNRGNFAIRPKLFLARTIAILNDVTPIQAAMLNSRYTTIREPFNLELFQWSSSHVSPLPPAMRYRAAPPLPSARFASRERSLHRMVRAADKRLRQHKTTHSRVEHMNC